MRHVSFVLLLVVLAGSLPAQPTAVPADKQQNAATNSAADESWQVILMRGQRIGYSHSTSREELRNGETVTISDAVSKMSIARLGQKLNVTQTMQIEENAKGELLSFSSHMDNPPASSVRSSGSVKGQSMEVTTTSGGKAKTQTIQHTGPILSPSYPERFLNEKGLAVGESASFEVFDTEIGKIVTVSLKRAEDKETTVWGGEKKVLKHISMSQSYLPGLTISLFADDDWNVVKMVTPIVGMEMYTVDAEEALKELQGEPLDLAIDTLIPLKIGQDPHQATAATYHIRVDAGQPAALFAAGTTQRIEVIDEDEIRLHVTAHRPGQNTSQAPAEPATDAGQEFLASSRFVPFEDPLIAKLSDAGDGDLTEPSQVAVALEKYVRSTITSKNFSTAMATALEVAKTRSGDCTEHSVLLVALLRAKGIPSRVAIGFVYSPSHEALVGHMWTEAYLDGKWIPLDGTMGRGGIGVGHIKVADSSLADEGTFPVSGFVPLIHLLGRTSIEVISIE